MQSTRQKIMATIYPAILFMGKVFGAKAKVVTNQQHIKSMEPLPLNTIILNNGKPLSTLLTNNKKILFVNTASGCGYTPQYAQLQQLQNNNNNVVVIAFPANDFLNQEAKNNEAIAQFCQVNYGVSFPLSQKTTVVGNNMHPIFSWLTSPAKNGWCSQTPEWNFSKYLVAETGELLGYFGSGVSPLDKRLTALL